MPLGFYFGLAQLDRIESKLNALEAHMSEQEAALDTALAEQGAKIDALVVAVNALIAAIPPGVDLADEIATVQGAAGEIAGLTTTVEGATPAA